MRLRNTNDNIGTRENTDTKYFALIVAALSFAIGQAAAGDIPKSRALPVGSSQAVTKRKLVVSVPDRKLAVIENGAVVRIYAIAVGAHRTPTPDGRFKVANRIANPTYYHKGAVIRPGRANPLGNRWMGLDAKGYGIHGTNIPASIGRAASHGCIRMGKHDVEELFTRVRIGDAVEIHRERSAELAAIFHSVLVTSANPKTVIEVKPSTFAVMAATAGELQSQGAVTR